MRYKVIKPIKPKKKKKVIKIWQTYSGDWIAAYDDDPNADNELASGRSRREVSMKLIKMGLSKYIKDSELIDRIDKYLEG